MSSRRASVSSIDGGRKPATATRANDPRVDVAVDAPADCPTTATRGAIASAFDERVPVPDESALVPGVPGTSTPNLPLTMSRNVAATISSLVAEAFVGGGFPGRAYDGTVSGLANDSANSGATTKNPDAASASARSTRSKRLPRYP